MDLTEKLKNIYEKTSALKTIMIEEDLKRPEDDLRYWLTAICQAASLEDLYSLLDMFRSGQWNDDQRAQVSHWYMRCIDRLS